MLTLRAAVVGDVYIMTGGVGSWLYMAPEVVRHRLREKNPLCICRCHCLSSAAAAYGLDRREDPLQISSMVMPKPNADEAPEVQRTLVCTHGDH